MSPGTAVHIVVRPVAVDRFIVTIVYIVTIVAAPQVMLELKRVSAGRPIFVPGSSKLFQIVAIATIPLIAHLAREGHIAYPRADVSARLRAKQSAFLRRSLRFLQPH